MPNAAAAAEGKLVLYHWFEYMPQELLDKFTAETGIEVTMDTYDSNEAMLAVAEGRRWAPMTWPCPATTWCRSWPSEGMLDTIADGELKNKGNIAPEWADPAFDPGRKHSIPYQWGSTSFAVNRDVYSGNIQTTDILFNPPKELSGQDQHAGQPGRSDGDGLAAPRHPAVFDTTATQLKALNAMLQAPRRHWARSTRTPPKKCWCRATRRLAMIYDGFGAKAREEGANIEYAYPGRAMLSGWTTSCC